MYRVKPADFPFIPHAQVGFESLNEVLRAKSIVVSTLELKGMDGRADSGSQVVKCA